MDVITYITNLFLSATQNRASDIHIEPQSDCLRIRQRIDGFLIAVDSLPLNDAPAVISRLKVMTNLDIGEKRLPQDGSVTLHQGENLLDIRISTMPTVHGEKIVLRLLSNRKEVVTVDQLGMAVPEEEALRKLLTCSSGLLIVTGPTGSGKTTTLYAMLQALNGVERNVVTLEDPIELQLPGVNQVQIHPRAGLTFSNGLRAVLRQDPDIIMIGEIRDKETADIAMSAALTGHLVLTTLHTRDAASAITRLLDMNIEPYRVAAALTGVVAQRLVRLVCHQCNGAGCMHCQETGYYERTGVFEVVSSTVTFQEKINQQVPLSELRDFFRIQGIRSLYETALEKVHHKQTTMNEIVRVMGHVEEKEGVES